MSAIAVPAVAAATLGTVFSVVSQNVPSGDVQSLITQLGVFGIVVVVFKFMLGRQDVRDAESDQRDADTLIIVQAELEHERAARSEDRTYFLDELGAERDKHEATRRMLYDTLIKAAILDPNEDAADRATRIQHAIADMVGSLVVPTDLPK